MSVSEKNIPKQESDTSSSEMITKNTCVTRDSLPITNGVSSTSSPDLTSRESSLVEDCEQESADLNHVDTFSDDSNMSASGAANNMSSLPENQMNVDNIETMVTTSSLTVSSGGAANMGYNHLPPENVPTEYLADSSQTFHQDHVTYMPQNIHSQMAMKPGHMTVTGQGQVVMTSQGHLSVSTPSAGSVPVSHGIHPANQAAMPTPPHSDNSSPNTHSPQGETNSPSPNTSSSSHTGHQHVVHVHINPGETFSVRVGDQLQNIQGKLIIEWYSVFIQMTLMGWRIVKPELIIIMNYVVCILGPHSE